MGGSASIDGGTMVCTYSNGSVGIKARYLVQLEAHMGLPAKRPIVTIEDEQCMMAVWAAVVRGTSAFCPRDHITPTKFFYTTFYSLLFAAKPSIRRLFRSSMTLQGRVLTALIGALATATRTDHSTFNIQQLALHHAKYGATNDDYVVLGNTLLQTLFVVSGTDWSTDAHNAFLNAYCLYYYIMLPVILQASPRPIKSSLCANVVATEAIACDITRIVLFVNHPLRYHPGDAVLLQLAIPDAEGDGIRRAFPLTSICENTNGKIEICVQRRDKVSNWLCDRRQEDVVHVCWITSGIHLETDTPEFIAPKLLFVSQGVDGAPFVAMTKGLYAVQDKYPGDIVWLQIADEPIAYFCELEWHRCRVVAEAQITKQRLQAVAPDISERHMFVSGSAAFIESVCDLFLDAGGTQCTVYSFEDIPTSDDI
ncbi:hypothetical protein ACHHYP_16612 [Achlya hypogyna]|uniref:FAD-binding FR-type domain-containing protein n=1 Tax=Achlya hypogyna TaxID=1202772 RepID=A0A1V9Y6C9_ACHHY|nr:hypothetical protein ACHHYP_16612 [Achlya hypogyna]